MKYRIGDMANIMGVTPGALHFFERKNIIRTKKEENGYRYYDEDDVLRLLSYYKYHSMGIPVKEIGKHFSGKEKDRNKVIERVRQIKNEYIEKIAEYEQLINHIDEHIKGCEKISELVGNYEFVQSPESLFMRFGQDGWISPDKEVQSKIHKWVEAMPATRISILCSGWEKQNAELTASFGYTLKRELMTDLCLPQDAGEIIQLPSVSCLHTVAVANPDFTYSPGQIFEETLKYIYNRHLIPTGPPWGTILLVDVHESIINPVVELWFPIR